MTLSIGCVIVTYQAKNHLRKVLKPLLLSPLKPRILVVDSSSSDGTVEIAHELGVEVIVIPQKEFNHGNTREMARRHLGTDIIAMLTQDAYLVDEYALTFMTAPLIEGKAAIAYARQIPHQGAGFFESFPREFNYPKKSELRSFQDVAKHGTYTFFCSNSCAAYDNRKLDEIGGFSPVLLGEDTVATAKLLRRGYKIAYVAEATVYHSHCYSLKKEFIRSYQTGLARKSYKELLVGGNSDSRRGVQYAKKMIKTLAVKSPHLLPYGCIHIFIKWLGYRLGAVKKT